MSRLEISSSAYAESAVYSTPLQDATFLESLKTLEFIICTSFGPNGKLKCIKNTSNGYAYITSASKRILSSLSPTHPLMKLIADSLKAHLNINADSGLFALLLCLHLIEGSQSSPLPSQLYSSIIECIMQKYCNYIESAECQCKFPARFDNLDELLALIRSVLVTKPGCCFSEMERKHLNLQIAKAFLETIAESGEKRDQKCPVGQIIVITREGWPVSSSCVIPGLLWTSPNPFPKQHDVKIALVNCSLAGDVDLDAYVSKIEASQVSIESCMLQKIKNFGSVLSQNGVNMLACQKVIHPLLKKYLKKNGVLWIERLGKEVAEQLGRISGAKPIVNLKSELDQNLFGHLKTVENITLCKKTYLLLNGKENSICTLLLCNTHEEALAEAKVTVQQAIDVLYSTLQYPWVLLGAGCTETHTVVYISQKIRSELSQISSDIGCSPSDVLQCLELLLRSILKTAASLYPDSENALYIDHEYGHMWDSDDDPLAECKCGQLKQQQLGNRRFSCFGKAPCTDEPLKPISHPLMKGAIIDGFSARLNAYKTAASVSAAVLRSGVCIIDRN